LTTARRRGKPLLRKHFAQTLIEGQFLVHGLPTNALRRVFESVARHCGGSWAASEESAKQVAGRTPTGASSRKRRRRLAPARPQSAKKLPGGGMLGAQQFVARRLFKNVSGLFRRRLHQPEMGSSFSILRMPLVNQRPLYALDDRFPKLPRRDRSRRRGMVPRPAANPRSRMQKFRTPYLFTLSGYKSSVLHVGVI